FLMLAFEPQDWAAVFLKSYQNGRVAQRVGPVKWLASQSFQSWIWSMNAKGFNAYVSVNAVARGCRSRTRSSISAIRHVFLEADHDGAGVLAHVHDRNDLPKPSYVLCSSPDRVHLFWRAKEFTPAEVERLQKHLACELRTDPAATPITQ